MENSVMENPQGRSGSSASLSPQTLRPSIPPLVKLGLTLLYTLFYCVLFCFIYAQLWLVLRYRHKRFSFQTVFLFLCLLWAALRALLFSFYFRDCVTVNTLGPFSFWMLYCLPVCLQFFTLILMNLYCAQVFFKAKSKFSPHLQKYKFPLYLLFVGVSLLFLLVNLTCALLVKTSVAPVKTIVLVRVTINDSLFILCAVSLSVCLYKVAKMSLASIYLESKGTSVCQVTLIGLTVILLYASRACYNLLVLALTDIQTINSFDYDWYNVSDQTEVEQLFPCVRRRICAPVWAMPASWCSDWFCSSGSFCPQLWWCSSSGSADRHRSGAALPFPATSSPTGRTSSTIPDATTATTTSPGRRSR
ncbi:G protein-coupled receptor 137Ba isoform X2 [Siphateles boraxobius]|uniref:G protein-coupled receptor 137Ba isoform X2 n=1 Tax=Siphateles boraxobius TaxID=180520 RepID=UPI0040636D2C